MVIRDFKYTPEDVDCRFCTEFAHGRCKATKCPWIKERIEAGVVSYRKSGYSKKYLEEHESDIIIHKAAKKAFDEMGVKKLPTIKSLQVEFADLLAAKKDAYAELKKVRDELRDLSVHKANYEELRDLEEREQRKAKEHGRDDKVQ